MTRTTYVCARCGGTFDKGWTDEEALAEKEVLWGPEIDRAEQFIILCNDCFEAFMKWHSIGRPLND